eukprot:10301331-Alexandrium_andersonii.AAC.1
MSSAGAWAHAFRVCARHQVQPPSVRSPSAAVARAIAVRGHASSRTRRPRIPTAPPSGPAACPARPFGLSSHVGVRLAARRRPPPGAERFSGGSDGVERLD